MTITIDADVGADAREAVESAGAFCPPMETLPRRRVRWPWIASVLAYVMYAVIGGWLLLVRHYAIGDALSRTATAKMMVLGRDPHLANMGYYWMPGPTISRIPFILITQLFGHAELAGPLSSAMFAALTLPVLAAIGRTLKLPTGTTVAIVAAFALNPVTMYIAANGMSESAFGFFLAVAMWAYLRWRLDARTTSLCWLGLALGGAMTCRYEALVIAPALAVAVMVAVPAGRRIHSAVLVVLPTATVFALWSLNSLLIMGDWLFWKHGADPLTATPADAVWLPVDRTFTNIFEHNAFMVITLAPAVVVVIVGLAFFRAAWRTSLGVVGMILLLPAVLTWQTYKGTSWDVPRFFVLTPMFVTIGVMWLLRTSRVRPGWSPRLAVLCIGLLVLGAITGTVTLSNTRRTSVEGESVFFKAVLGHGGDDQKLADDNGQIVYVGDLAPFRQLNRDLTPSFEAGRVVALDTIIALPFLVADHPDNYLIPEDRSFESTLSDPIGRIDFIIRINSSRSTGYGATLDNILTITDGGKWQEVGIYGDAVRLYEWVPTGQHATVKGPGVDEVPVS